MVTASIVVLPISTQINLFTGTLLPLFFSRSQVGMSTSQELSDLASQVLDFSKSNSAHHDPLSDLSELLSQYDQRKRKQRHLKEQNANYQASQKPLEDISSVAAAIFDNDVTPYKASPKTPVRPPLPSFIYPAKSQSDQMPLENQDEKFYSDWMTNDKSQQFGLEISPVTTTPSVRSKTVQLNRFSDGYNSESSQVSASE